MTREDVAENFVDELGRDTLLGDAVDELADHGSVLDKCLGKTLELCSRLTWFKRTLPKASKTAWAAPSLPAASSSCPGSLLQQFAMLQHVSTILFVKSACEARSSEDIWTVLAYVIVRSALVVVADRSC